MARSVRVAVSERTMQRASERLGVLRSDTCLIKRPVAMTDAIGAPIGEVFDTVAAIDCGIDESPGGVLRVLGPVLAAVSSAVIRFPLGADVRDQDIVEVARTGFRYLVGGVTKGSSIQFEVIAAASRAQ